MKCLACFTSFLIIFTSLSINPVRAQVTGNSPILLLTDSKEFGSFTAEIIRTEGFNEFQTVPLSHPIQLEFIKKFDILLLTKTNLPAIDIKTLIRYVEEGGNLIAFRPDKQLYKIFGIKDSKKIIDGGYLSINTQTEIGKGLLDQPLKFHGEADLCELNGGSLLAEFKPDKRNPAVVLNHFGKGYALAFLYNLPLSVAYTRQGNYKDAAIEMDGITGIRAMDMFTNGWVDTTQNLLNQADEQMRLLTHGIELMNPQTKPLPRFWYFPDALNCLVSLTNDGEDSKEEEFQPQFVDVDAKGAGMTLYIKEVDLVSKPWVDQWRKKGFEISGHPDDTKQATNPDWETMDHVYGELISKLDNSYGIKGMRTVTNHWFVWCGRDEKGIKNFVAQALIEEKHGIKLDCNYAHYDNNSNQGHFLGALGYNQGNYTGSGLVMKFANPEGAPIHVYQQLNNVYDQQYMEHKDPDGYFQCFKGLMDRSLEKEVYSFISVKAHNNEYYFSKLPLMKMLDYANEKGIPVLTEEEFLEFLEAKDEAQFTDIKWIENRLSFEILSSIPAERKISCLVPFLYNGMEIGSIRVNGETTPSITRIIKGHSYAILSVKPGTNYQVSVDYIKK